MMPRRDRDGPNLVTDAEKKARKERENAEMQAGRLAGMDKGRLIDALHNEVVVVEKVEEAESILSKVDGKTIDKAIELGIAPDVYMKDDRARDLVTEELKKDEVVAESVEDMEKELEGLVFDTSNDSKEPEEENLTIGQTETPPDAPTDEIEDVILESENVTETANETIARLTRERDELLAQKEAEE